MARINKSEHDEDAFEDRIENEMKRIAKRLDALIKEYYKKYPYKKEELPAFATSFVKASKDLSLTPPVQQCANYLAVSKYLACDLADKDQIKNAMTQKSKLMGLRITPSKKEAVASEESVFYGTASKLEGELGVMLRTLLTAGCDPELEEFEKREAVNAKFIRVRNVTESALRSAQVYSDRSIV